jgi:hypothetical protein
MITSLNSCKFIDSRTDPPLNNHRDDGNSCIHNVLLIGLLLWKRLVFTYRRHMYASLRIFPVTKKGCDSRTRQQLISRLGKDVLAPTSVE